MAARKNTATKATQSKTTAPAKAAEAKATAADATTTTDATANATEPKEPEQQEPQKPTEPEGETDALFIKSHSATGFRRCGMRFTPEGHSVALELLSAEQVATLKADANLIIEPCTQPANA